MPRSSPRAPLLCAIALALLGLSLAPLRGAGAVTDICFARSTVTIGLSQDDDASSADCPAVSSAALTLPGSGNGRGNARSRLGSTLVLAEASGLPSPSFPTLTFGEAEFTEEFLIEGPTSDVPASVMIIANYTVEAEPPGGGGGSASAEFSVRHVGGGLRQGTITVQVDAVTGQTCRSGFLGSGCEQDVYAAADTQMIQTVPFTFPVDTPFQVKLRSAGTGGAVSERDTVGIAVLSFANPPLVVPPGYTVLQGDGAPLPEYVPLAPAPVPGPGGWGLVALGGALMTASHRMRATRDPQGRAGSTIFPHSSVV